MILAVEDSMLSDTDACDGLKHDNWHPFVVSPPFLLLSRLPSSGCPAPVLFPFSPASADVWPLCLFCYCPTWQTVFQLMVAFKYM